ncbi:DUF302 domain-containing protein [Minwuia sp.]|uniref:DUF302 domain-containing protein n=1 Tax=Minwuia sp. TaxID=2493630 RepID=UPI003A93296B
MRRALIVLFALFLTLPAQADQVPGTVTLPSSKSFAELADALEAAVDAEGFFVVSRASASAGAAGRGIKIPGNLVVGVFRNDFAVRMLAASVPAGIEAPLRFYITERADGTAALTYRIPTDAFAPYDGGDALNRMAAELDVIWARIASTAVE